MLTSYSFELDAAVFHQVKPKVVAKAAKKDESSSDDDSSDDDSSDEEEVSRTLYD